MPARRTVIQSARTRATKTRIGLKYLRMNGWGPLACSKRSIGIIIRCENTTATALVLSARNEQGGGHDRDQERVVQQRFRGENAEHAVGARRRRRAGRRSFAIGIRRRRRRTRRVVHV